MFHSGNSCELSSSGITDDLLGIPILPFPPSPTNRKKFVFVFGESRVEKRYQKQLSLTSVSSLFITDLNVRYGLLETDLIAVFKQLKSIFQQ